MEKITAEVEVITYRLNRGYTEHLLGRLPHAPNDRHAYTFKTEDGKILRYTGRRKFGDVGSHHTIEYSPTSFIINEEERYFTIKITKVFH